MHIAESITAARPYYEVTTTLANSITSVFAKPMVAVFSGENLTGIMTGIIVLFPGSNALTTKELAVVGAAGIDGRVHVGHQDLPEHC